MRERRGAPAELLFCLKPAVPGGKHEACLLKILSISHDRTKALLACILRALYGQVSHKGMSTGWSGDWPHFALQI
jgi:hypothetical protein